MFARQQHCCAKENAVAAFKVSSCYPLALPATEKNDPESKYRV